MELACQLESDFRAYVFPLYPSHRGVTCYHMDHAQWEKAVMKQPVSYDSIHSKCPEQGGPWRPEAERPLLGAVKGGRGHWGSDSQRVRACFLRWRKCSKIFGGDKCTYLWKN